MPALATCNQTSWQSPISFIMFVQDNAEKRCVTQYYARLQAHGEQRVLDLLSGR